MGVFYRQSPLIIGDVDVATIGDPKVGLINGNSGGPGHYRYFNTTLNQWYYWSGSSWVSIGGGGVSGEVEMEREGGGKVKLVFTNGIVTEIEDEA